MNEANIDRLYNNLTTPHRDLLHLMVFYRDLTTPSLEYYLWTMIDRNYKKHWPHSQFSGKEVKAMLARLRDMGYFHEGNNIINEEVYAYLFSKTIQSQDFATQVLQSLSYSELNPNYASYHKLIRLAYYFLYKNETEALILTFEQLFGNAEYYTTFQHQKIAVEWFSEDATFYTLLKVEDRFLYPILKLAILESGLPNWKAFSDVESTLLLDKIAMQSPSILSVLFEGNFFRGDVAKMESYLSQIPAKSWHKPAKTAWLAMAKGQYLEASVAFEEAIKPYRKEYHTKKDYFKDINALFYHFCIFKLKNLGKIKEIQSFIERIPTSNPNYKAFLYQSAYCKHLQNLKSEAQYTLAKYSEFLLGGIQTFTHYTCVVLMDIKPPLGVKLLQPAIDKALGQGNLWLYMELSALLASLVPSEVEAKAEAEKIAQQFKLAMYAPSDLEKESEWEIALNAVQMAFTPKEGKAASTKPTRLAWIVSLDPFTILPKEQALSKKGEWSGGKNIALKRLKEEQLDFMEAQDLRICRHLKEFEMEGWGYYNRTYLGWDYPKAFLEMIGHPLIFLEQAPTIAIELVKEEVQIIVTQKGSKYELALSVDKILQEGVMIRKETPTRYKVLQIKKEHLLFYQATQGKKITVPKEGKEKLAKITAELSKTMTVQSDLGEDNQNLPTVEADVRMYIHLLPLGDGFSLEMFSKPFQTHPPYFKPGNGGENIIAEIDAIRTRTKRNLKAEKENYKKVEAACPTLAQNASGEGVWLLEDANECLDVLSELDSLRKEEKIIIEWPKGEKLKLAHKADFKNFSFSINKKQDWFEVEGELKLDTGLVMGMQELLALMQKSTSNYIQIGDGQFLALTKAFQKKLNELSAVIGDKGKKGMQVHPLAALTLDDFSSELSHVKSDKAWKDQIAKIKDSRKLKPQVPKNFEADLRPYQMEGFTWLSQLAHWGVGACLADDMGLGKTIQALAVILARASEGPTLVVAPVSVCRNWEKECLKFAPTLTPILFVGSLAERKEIIGQVGKYDLLICSYGLLQQESELLVEKHFTTIVLDEAQAIKNHQTKRAKAAFDLQGDFKILTTGTPIENHLGELWSLFNFINPGFLGSLTAFQERFSNPIEKQGNKEKKQHLKRLIAPFILRRKKNEVLDDLPAKTEITLTVQLSDEERAFYEALRQNALANIQNTNAEATDIRFQILAEITRLRRACCNPQLITKNNLIESSKLKLFEEVVEELLENGHKALVFSQYIEHLAILKQNLDEKSISYQYLDGSTPAAKRQASVDAFQKGEGELFLISLKAGGTGLNLTAADYVIHMDPWWNPAVEDQASDRVHRIGQKRPVTVYRLVTENTIEEKILALHHDKRDLADSLLEGTDSSSKLSAEDLLNLLKG